jgi:hypothetical protein
MYPTWTAGKIDWEKKSHGDLWGNNKTSNICILVFLEDEQESRWRWFKEIMAYNIQSLLKDTHFHIQEAREKPPNRINPNEDMPRH